MAGDAASGRSCAVVASGLEWAHARSSEKDVMSDMCLSIP